MTLQPGYRLAVAARVHLDPGWGDRVRVGGGVEEADGGVFPRGPWRPPTDAELACLVSGPDPAGAADAVAELVALFRLPDHLLDEWWGLLDAAAGADGRIREFEPFAAKVRGFLDFKGLAPAGPTQMEAVVTAAGERSIRRDPETGRPSGLGPTVAPWSPFPPGAGAAGPRLHAVVNLGDEPTGVVLFNLPHARLAAKVASRRPDLTAAGTVGELVGQFFRACLDYPPVRVRLGPGEGVRLPAAGLVLDGDPTDKQEPDVLLLVTAGA